MAQAPAELSVITRMYDLAVWTCRHVARFDRGHRFTLGERLERQANRVLEGLLRARYDSRGRADLVRQVNVELELLRFQFRLAKDLRCLSLDGYGYSARVVNEVGQMVGGWLKKSGPPA